MNNQPLRQDNLSIRKPEIQVNNKLIQQRPFDKKEAIVNTRREAFDKAMLAICSRPAESGGLLLGEIGSSDISDFFFDSGGNFSSASYSPDHLTLNRKMKEEWMPAGIDMKGFVHSHPGRLDVLTDEDLMYIERLLKANPDMSMFVAPIIIPPEFRMHMMVVYRDNPGVFVEARINFY
ncbi:MAG: hypothetical protein JXB29_07670 [Sedimentisphaerales bacterium]|nr:hypothetical protein [Sedimentisphaerales bacterium]